jgi:hypothetical protein
MVAGSTEGAPNHAQNEERALNNALQFGEGVWRVVGTIAVSPRT